MVAGRTWPTGDPFLQRQDEPSIAVSSRNVLHLVAGSNDYRTVDLPGLPADKPTGDAWLGLFKSFDGGKTWQSNLIPGYPQDQSGIGLTSPLKGFDAGADPLVRAGANGLIFYSGIVFQRAAIVGAAPPDSRVTSKARKASVGRAKDREREKERERKKKRDRKLGRSKQAKGPRSQPLWRIRGGAEDDDEVAGTDGTASAIFVSTLIDLNNTEGGDPISYVRTTLVDRDPGTRFLDKQWMAVDVPRAGAQMCVIDAPQANGPPIRQSMPGGRIYVAYTAFSGSGPTQRGRIMFSYSADCGATWSRPRDISTVPDPDINDDGIVNTTDYNIARAAFGKKCGDVGFDPLADTNGDCLVDIFDLSFISKNLGKTFPTARRIPQGASIAINPLTGAIYIAWREFKATGLPDAIQFVQSTNFGASFTTPITVSTFYPYDQGTTDTSFRTSAFPTIAADGQRIYLGWAARNFAKRRPDPTLDDARIVMSTSTNGSAWTAPRVVDEPSRPGHQIMPALTFGAGKLSLLYYDLRDDVSQLFGPFVDELPIITSNPPGLRHTLDVRIAQAPPGDAPVFESVQLSEYPIGAFTDGAPLQQLQFNPPNLPIFRQGSAPFMGDYIDLVTSPSIRSNPDGTWSFNIEPSSAAAGHAIWTDNRDVRPGPGGDLSQYTPPNSPSRGNVSLYDPTQPLAACNPDFTSTRDQNIYTARFDQGLFAAAVNNSKQLDGTPRAFAVFVENAAADIRSYRLTIANQPPGGTASFEQFSALSVLDVSIPPHSTAARTVYVSSTLDPAARVTINVEQIAAAGGQLVVGGQQGSIVLNGDPTAPRLENASETYDPLLSAAIVSPRIENPRLENPRLENPRLENVSISNVGILNPRLENPDLENPRIENPRIENPRLENPRIENATIVNGTISDTTWELTNTGNTTAVYSVKLLLNQPVPTNFETELVIHKTYTTPTAVGCDLRLTQRNVIVTNITTPAFDTPADVGNPRIENPRIENATVALAPGESANVTLRVFDPNRNDAVTFDAAAAVTPAAVSQSVNTDDAAAGVTQPPVTVAISITTPFLATVTPGGAYNQTLQANVPGTWSIVAGVLPPGLSLDSATGVISGTATTPGTYAFTIAFTDTASPPHTATHDYVIYVAAPLQIATTALLDGVRNVSYLDTVAISGGVGTVTFAITAGALPPGLAIEQLTGRISGTPTAIGTFTFTVTASDQAQPNVPASRAYTVRVTDAVAEIDKTWVGGDTNWSNAGNWVPAGVPGSQNNVLIPANSATQPALTADSSVGSLQVAPGATLNLGGHTLRAFGSVDGGNTIVNGTLQVGGQDVTVAGTVPNLDVLGPVTFIDFLHVTGNLTLHGGPVSLLGTHHSVVDGSLIVPNGQASVPQIIGGNGALNIGGVDVDGLVLDGASLAVTGGPIARFDRVLFQNFDPALTQLAISSPGAATPFAFNQLIFTTTPTTGFYISASDSSADGNIFTINLVDAQATDGPAHTQTTNGAVVNWPATGSADLVVTQFDAPDPVQVGNNVVYSISVTNNGPDTAISVGLIDVLPQTDGTPLVTFVSATPTQGTCGAASGVVTCTLGNLAAGGTISVTVTATTLQAGTITNAVTVGAGTPDPNTLNNTSLEPTTVTAIVALADLAVSKSHAPAQPVLGQPLTYLVVVTNVGPAAALNTVVTDTLPAGVDFVSATSTVGSCTQNAGVVTCAIGQMGPATTVTITLVVTPVIAQPLTNTTSVSSSTPDPNAANNSASDLAVVTFGPCVAPSFYGPDNTTVSTGNATAVALADFNHDGMTDGAATESSLNQIAIVLGQNGPDIITHVAVGTNPVSIVTADFNHDDNADIAVANQGSGNVSVLLGNGQGGFSPVVNITVAGAFGLAAGDMNQDGFADLVVGPNTGTSIAVLLWNSATGAFNSPVSYPANGTSPSLVVADFDADNKLDVIAANRGATTAAFLKGDGLGAFAAPVSIAVGASVVAVRAIGNVDGVNGPDLGVTTGDGSATNTNLVRLLNAGNGTFTPPVQIVDPSVGAVFTGSGDFNGDGKMDLAVTSLSAQGVLVLLGNGDGTFGSPTTYIVGSNPTQFVVYDVNGDGRMDLVGGRGANGDIWVLENLCGSTASADLTLTAASTATVLAGQNATLTLTVTNHSTTTPATNLILNIALPNGTSFNPQPADANFCGQAGATMYCSPADIPPNGSTSFQVTLRVVGAGTKSFPATVAAFEVDPNPADNTATATTTVTGNALTFTVTNTNDSGVGSLRSAIGGANANSGSPSPNQISFNIPGTGPFTITPLTALPTITSPVIINGTTQPGFNGTPIIELSGATAGASGANGLRISAGASTVRGLVINRWRNGLGGTGAGIQLDTAGGNVIVGNYIGTDVAGGAGIVSARETGNNAITLNTFGNRVGIRVQSPNNVIGGTTAADRNVISGNSSLGVDIRNDSATGLSGTGSTVSGNYIGTDASGTAVNPNGLLLTDNGVGFSAQGAGIEVFSSPNVTIGGATSSAGNVISGNANGIDASGPNTIIQNNLIGTNASATAVLRFPTGSFTGDWTEGRDGILVGTNTAIGPGNVIAGHSAAGIVIAGFGASTGTATIFGNFIGTNTAGSAGLGNGDGILIAGGSGIVVGGTAGRNVISGNGNGISLLVNAGTPASNNQISNNYIGVTPGGAAARANGTGVRIVGAINNTIGGTTAGAGNLISGNGTGVSISSGASGNVVQGNLIGTRASGDLALGNTGAGVSIDTSSNNTIGGTTASARNIISGNSGAGVQIAGSATNNRIQGNYIGTDIAGTSAVPNTQLQSGIFLIGGPSNNIIGGATAGAGNVVSGNAQHAITIVGPTSAGNVVQGNFVGVDASGAVKLANGGIGLDIVNPPNTIVGGAGSARNVISGNGVGIQIRTGATGTVVQNNYIGVDASGTNTIANGGNGVQIIDASDNTIGGTAAGQGNVIVGNGGTGVSVTGDTSVNNAIRGNTINANTFLGIDLGSDGVTTNDTNDADGSPNHLQNFPVLTQAAVNGATVSVAGSLNSVPNAAYQLDFFASAVCDPSGNGEGQTFLGSLPVTTGATGNVTFNSGFPFAGGAFITATATDGAGNTSEFSACAGVTSGATTITVSNTNDTGPGSFRQAILDANSHQGLDTISFAVSGNGVQTITPLSPLPAITDPVVIDATTQPGFTGTPLIELNGSSAGSTNGLTISTGGSTVRGLAINRFSGPLPGAGNGISIAGAGNIVQGNFIGTNAAGTAALPNASFGIVATGSANLIGGTNASDRNVISGNSNSGVLLLNAGATNNIVQGNLIGTDVTGTVALSNQGWGIFISGPNNIVGGTTAGARNVIAGSVNTNFGGVGISSGSSQNQILGNYIGTNQNGTAALGNYYGVRVEGPANVVGGTASGAQNVISGNTNTGVSIINVGNQVLGNLIGTTISGIDALPNGSHGISIAGGSGTVGGLESGAGNVIAFNVGSGVAVISGTGSSVRANSIFSNTGLGIDLGSNGVTLNDGGDVDTGPNNLQNFPIVTAATVSGGSISIVGTLNSAPGAYALDFFANAACDASGNGEGAVLIGSTLVNTDGAGNAVINASFPFAGGATFVTATATDAAGNTSEFSACRATTATGVDLALSISDAPDPVAQGQNVTYTYLVTNNGTATANVVTLIGSFGAGLSFVSATNGCQFGSACSMGPIASGASSSLSVTMRADAAGLTFASATVTSDANDANTADNSDTETTTVTGAAPQTFVVNNTNDAGAGSLRQAILDANANLSADTITFNIPGTGVHTITPASALPTITEQVTIAGISQPGWTPTTPVIELNGANAGPAANGLVISGATSESTQVSGLVINRFGTGGAGPQAAGGAGIVVQGAEGVQLLQNVIGLDPSGTIARGNRSDGVFIDSTSGSASGFFINASVVSGNGRNGIRIAGATASAGGVIGNRIGTDAVGQTAIGNGLDGVSISGVVDGGVGVVSNVISGNRRFGVSVLGNGSESSIYANTIGANLAGTAAVPNGAGGVLVDNSTLTVIGQPGLGNTIAFNNGNGVSINSGTQNFINSNSIFSNGGLGIDLAPAGSLAAQVLDFEDRSDTIANPTAFPGSYQGVTWTNWLEVEPVEPRGYVQDGANSIFAAVSGATFTFPARTFLGARFSRSSSVFSPGAVFFELYLQGSLVATSPVLADNAPPLTFLPSDYQGLVDEVRVISQGSSMTAQGAAWIMDDVLFGNGVTTNDADDADVGGNDLQNFPAITAATSSGGTTVIQATLTSTPDTAFNVEFFSSPTCGPSGIGQGRTLIGSTIVAGDPSGTIAINASLGVTVASGQFVTATATNPDGNTSEFSNCVAVGPSLAVSPNPLNLVTNDSVTVTATLGGPAGPGGVTISLASSDPSVTVPPTVLVPANATSATFAATTGAATGTATITASAPGLPPVTVQATVALRTMTLGTISPLVGVGHTLAGTITLARPAPAGGLTVHLASSNTAFGTVTPADVIIGAASSSGSFTVSGVGAGDFTISATASGVQSANLALTATVSSLISLGSGVVVAPGNDAGLALSIGIPAPQGGLTVTLASSDTSKLTVTPTVIIPEGLKIPASNPTVHGVAIGQAFVTAAAAGFAPDSQNVSVTVSLSFSPTTLTVIQGRTTNIALNLSSPAPAGGLTINTSIDNTSFATVPSSVQVAAGATSVQVPVTGVAIGNTTLRASAPGITEKTAAVAVNPQPAITITDQTVGKDLQVSTGGTLGAPAPAGNLVVTLTSLDPSKLLLSNSGTAAGSSSITVTASAGSSTVPSFFVQALADTGTADFQASAPGYATSTTTVTFQPSGVVWNSGNFSTTTLSGNTALSLVMSRLNPATLTFAQTQQLRGGLTATFTVSSGNTTVGTIVNPAATVNGGSSTTTSGLAFQPSVAGTSTLTFSTPSGFATATNFQQITATVTSAAITIPGLTIGKNLQASTGGSLGAAAPAGNLVVTLTSLDPSKVLLSNSGTAAGSTSITVTVSAGSSTVPGFFVQALTDTGTADVQASAPGYATSTTTVTFQPSGVVWNSGSFSTTTLSGNSALSLVTSRLNPSTLAFAQTQQLRGGMTATFTVSSGNTTVGAIVNPTATINGGSSTTVTGLAFQPSVAGTSTLTFSTPTGFSTPTNFQQITATVTSPAITISDPTIGKNLQVSTGGSLGAPAPAGNLTVTLTSLDPSKVLLSTSGTATGSASITVTVPAGSSGVPGFFIQALTDTGTADFQASAPGFATSTTTVTFQPSGVVWNTGNISTTTFSSDTALSLVMSRLNPATLAFVQTQQLRGGLTVNFTVASSDANIGEIVNPAATINGGSSTTVSGIAFHPRTGGSATLTFNTPSGFSTASNFQQLSASVTAPNINVSDVTVGRDLQVSVSVSLAVAPPSPVTVTVNSPNAALATITKDGTVAGGTSLTFTNVTTTSVGSFFIQGRGLGNTAITLQAAGYNDGTSNVTIDPSGVVWNSSNLSTTTFSADTGLSLVTSRLNPATASFVQTQALRGGLTLNFNVTSSNTNVGDIVGSPATIIGGSSTTSPGLAFHPKATGTTTLGLATPSGFTTPSNFQQITAAVSAPDVNISDTVVGRDLQTSLSITLAAVPPSPVTVTVTSSDGNLLTVSQNGTVAGTAAVTFTNVSGTNVGTIFVQGRGIGTPPTLTAHATGYNDGISTVTVVPSGFFFNTSSFSVSASGANQGLNIGAARLDPTTLNFVQAQSIRGGLTVDVSVTSSNTTVGTIVGSPVRFNATESQNTSGAFDPVAAGASTLTVVTPAGFSTPSNFRQITATVTPPDGAGPNANSAAARRRR